jgi:hypothetical protein
MSTADLLVSWSKRWTLRNGVVVCRGCGASQAERDKGAAFEHAISCPNARTGMKPWEDLLAAADSDNSRR